MADIILIVDGKDYKFKALLDTGAAKNELSSSVAKKMGLYKKRDESTYKNIIQTTLGSYETKEITLPIKINMRKITEQTNEPIIEEKLKFVYPKIPNNKPFVDVLIGREGLQELDFVISIKK
jgi:hypothetical protein